MELGILLNVIVLQSASIFQFHLLHARSAVYSISVFRQLLKEDEFLLVYGNFFLFLDLSFDGLNGIGLLNLKGDCFTG
jgi:hypothetical protein